MNQNPLAKSIIAAFEIDPWVNPHRDDITVDCHGSVVILSGEVAEIAAKRRAYYCALETDGVSAVDDRLRVRPGQPMGDDEILDHVTKQLYGDLAFQHYGLVTIDHKGEREVWRELPDQQGQFELHVESSVVFLAGQVKSLCDRRLAGVHPWWVPGTQDVINELAVSPPEEDSDDQLLEAVRLALAADRFVDPVQVTCHCRDGEVTLTGVVPVPEQIKMAEHDCWYTEGVRKVINQLSLP